jgi:hypothetical protein
MDAHWDSRYPQAALKMELAAGENVCTTKYAHAVPYAKEKEKACVAGSCAMVSVTCHVVYMPSVTASHVAGLKYGYAHFKPVVKKHW